MNILNSNRYGYEQLSSGYDQGQRVRRGYNKCHRVLQSFAVIVTVGFVGFIALVQMSSRNERQGLLIIRQGNTDNREILVSVEHGQMRGSRFESRDGRNYLAFLGIPFAKPPIGKLRFSPPQASDPWDPEILNATSPRPQCIQLAKNKVTGVVRVDGSEDCLYLNIYTPKTLEELSSRRNMFPVIVYVHGGVHNGNGSQFGGEYMMDEDVVLVILHFRLHVFGNLNTGDSVSRGNFAAKDQVMALRWVQNNIAKFGGDERRVTLYGTSYGAMLVSVHLLSPMSKGLFHQAILQSGSLLTVRNKDAGRKEAEKLAALVQCPTNSSEAMVNCLRETDAATLTLAVRHLDFAITIEPPSDNPGLESCVPDEPLKLIQAGEFNSVPTIHGTTSAEDLNTAFQFLFSLNDSMLSASISEKTKEEVMEKLIEFEQAKDPATLSLGLEELDRFQVKFREYYFGPWNLTRDTLLQNVTHLLSDREWVHPMSVFVRNQLKAEKQQRKPIFLYYFSKESTSSYANSNKERWGPSEVPFGVQHADDMQYFLPSTKFPYIPPSSPYYNFSRFVVRAWANFAKTGKPTSTDDAVEWKPIEPDDPNVPFSWFDLGDVPRMFEPFGIHDRIKFWDSLNLTTLYL